MRQLNHFTSVPSPKKKKMNVFLNPHIELSQQKQSNEDDTHQIQNEDEGAAGRC